MVSFNNIDEVNFKNGFVFNSFDNSENYLIEGLKPIDLNTLELFYSDSPHNCMSKNEYLDECNSLIATLKTQQVDKVVLSKIKKVDFKTSPMDVFSQLNEKYKNTFNYLISIENIGCWMGATPETLINIDKDLAKTVSIAGTKTIDINDWGEKEIEEQEMVSSFIASVLESHLSEFKMGNTETITAGKIQHLKTEFSGHLKNKYEWAKIVKDLHPTPATCGLPKSEAQSIIKSIEKHDRKFYTGFLGPISNNSKQLFVNLRCMEIQQNSAYLFLGGGITVQSIANDEWNETENKASTLLSVIK